MKILSIFTILLISLSMSACDNANKEPVRGSIDRSGKTISTTIHFYDNVDQVQDKFREIHKLPRDYKTGVQGFARWPEFRDANGNPVTNETELTCVIHTVRPTSIDDEATLTLGHEMLHCIIGTYHPEPQK